MRLIALFVCILLTIAGCGATSGSQAISGSVTLDDKPLATGSILFTPLDGTPGDAASGEINDGKFSIPAASGPHVGKHRVEIRALRKSGKKVQKPFAPEGELVERDEEAIADKFNSQSKLIQEVKAGANEASFQVTSRPAS